MRKDESMLYEQNWNAAEWEVSRIGLVLYRMTQCRLFLTFFGVGGSKAATIALRIDMISTERSRRCKERRETTLIQLRSTGQRERKLADLVKHILQFILGQC